MEKTDEEKIQSIEAAEVVAEERMPSTQSDQSAKETAAPLAASSPTETLVSPQPIQAFGATHKSHKKLIIIIVASVIGLLLAGAAAFAIYYFGIRVQNNEYGKAAVLVDSIIADIDHVQSRTGFGVFKPSQVVTASITTADETTPTLDDTTLQKVNEVKNSVKSMSENLSLLKKSPAVQHDSVVQNALAATEGSVTRYQTALTEAADSVEIITDISLKCATFSQKLENIQSLDEYDSAATGCSVALTRNKTIPLDDLNKKFYEPWRNAFLDLLSATRTAIVAYMNNDQATYQSAAQSIQNDGKIFEKLKADLVNYHYEPPTDPTKGLKDLKVTLHNRQTVFFR